MTDKEWNNEFQYQIIMSLVRQLKRIGTVSDNEYGRIDTIMIDKYRPIIGTLLSGKPLKQLNCDNERNEKNE